MRRSFKRWLACCGRRGTTGCGAGATRTPSSLRRLQVAPESGGVAQVDVLRLGLRVGVAVQQDPDQVVYLYTVARESGLWYSALAGQKSKMADLEPTFTQMINSVQFPD